MSNVNKRIKLPPDIEAALNNTGLNWTVEDGRRHRHIRIEGFLVTVISKNMRKTPRGDQGNRQMICHITRRGKEIAASLKQKEQACAPY